MCDQEHYDDDLRQYQSRGAVSRCQFGALSFGAGHDGAAAYSEAQAEKAWARMLVLFKKALA